MLKEPAHPCEHGVSLLVRIVERQHARAENPAGHPSQRSEKAIRWAVHHAQLFAQLARDPIHNEPIEEERLDHQHAPCEQQHAGEYVCPHHHPFLRKLEEQACRQEQRDRRHPTHPEQQHEQRIHPTVRQLQHLPELRGALPVRVGAVIDGLKQEQVLPHGLRKLPCSLARLLTQVRPRRVGPAGHQRPHNSRRTDAKNRVHVIDQAHRSEGVAVLL